MDLPDPKDLPRLNYSDNDLSIELNCLGSREYTKISYPVKYGIFSRLETRDLILEFNQNHEIRHARSKTRSWPDPQEWLKRTTGNDWVYYSTGGYAGVFESIGEYYLPNLMYTTNSLLGGKPFNEPEVARLSLDWHHTLAGIPLNRAGMPPHIRDWAEKIQSRTPADLDAKAGALFKISGGRTTVLPPDARHSDYDVIPLTIADGCLYKCKFCKVKNKKQFTPRTRADIDRQLNELKTLYADDLINYNSLFLGEHDALNAPADLILYAARTAHGALNFGKSVMKHPRLCFFGSVDAVLNAEERLFKELDTLPFNTCINIGLESADPATLEKIGKPVTAEKVTQAFDRMQAVNKTYHRVEMTCNFIMDEDLPPGHTTAMMALVRDRQRFTRPKGCVYLSPLRFGRPSREVLFDFYSLKTRSRLPMFLYIIQRL
ncbi:MAG: radical SAM protein [Desulfobacterales bacterium]|nr:radical SAM protein [Desulfobacterales bacterium]